MRTEEANRLIDKLKFLSLNSSKSNLVEYVVSTYRDSFKGKCKKNKKLNHPRQQNKFSDKIQKPKGLCYVCGKSGHKSISVSTPQGTVSTEPKACQTYISSGKPC